MADNQEIVVEIKLEDGTFRKAFASLKQDAEKAGKETGENLTDPLDGAIGKIAGKLSLIGAAWAAMAGAIKASEIAEEAQRIDAQFALLTERSGIMGSALSDALVKSSAGLVDNTDLLRAANKAMVELGAGAQKLPEFLDIARHATAVFGGTLIENFEKINFAVASGNVRALKHMGLVIDQEKAYKDYARSIGVTAGALTEAGRQQAIANAVLEKGKTAFAGMSSALGNNTESWLRFKTSVGQATENLSKAFDSLFGDVIEKGMNKASGTIDRLANALTATFGSGAEKTAAQIKSLNEELTYLQDIKLPSAEKFAPGEVSIVTARITKLREELALLDEQGRKMGTASREGAASVSPLAKQFDADKLAQDQQKWMQVLNQGLQDAVSAEAAVAVTRQELEASRIAALKLLRDQEKAEVLATDAAYKASGINNEIQHQEALANIEREYAAKRKALKTQEQREAEALSKAFTSAVVNVIVGGLHAIGEGLVKGGVGFDNFGKKILGLFGGFASMIGSFMITTAVGIIALGEMNPFAMLAAGAGLVILGGILSALASGQDEAVSTPSPGDLGNGGFQGGATSGGFGGTSTSDQIQEPQSKVVVNIQGNVLDRKGTGIEIAEIIRENFDLAGVTTVGAT